MPPQFSMEKARPILVPREAPSNGFDTVSATVADGSHHLRGTQSFTHTHAHTHTQKTPGEALAGVF
jgi:hypothetical protein